MIEGASVSISTLWPITLFLPTLGSWRDRKTLTGFESEIIALFTKFTKKSSLSLYSPLDTARKSIEGLRAEHLFEKHCKVKKEKLPFFNTKICCLKLRAHLFVRFFPVNKS